MILLQYSHLNVAAVGLVKTPEEVGQLLNLEPRQMILDIVMIQEIVRDLSLGIIELDTESSTHPSLVSQAGRLESGGLNPVFWRSV